MIFNILAANTQSEAEREAFTNQWLITSKYTKNRPHLIKDEANAMKSLICASPKQYVVNKHSDLSSFPFKTSNDPLPLQMKSKGVARSSQMKHLTFFDFFNTIVNDQPSRIVPIPALKRLDFQIYLIRTKKKLISKLNSKRAFTSLYRRKRHFFSFPLHYKRLQIIEWFPMLVGKCEIAVFSEWRETESRQPLTEKNSVNPNDIRFHDWLLFLSRDQNRNFLLVIT